MIPREIIEEIKARNDIVDTISSYVTLKRAGSNYNGLCPFHSEKTPSFTVFPATSSFYCFGCGVGGEVITFIMKAENLEYLPAVELLAKRAGIRLPQTESGRDTGMSRQRVLDMNLEAARFFRATLFDPVKGKKGWDYLHGVRKLDSATIKHFGLGFAPDDFTSLLVYLRSKGFTDDEMVRGYLAGRSREMGKIFSMFRNRVIFPIIDTTGNIVAFGGRVMDDSKPKYLNSSDTPGFKKSRNLFALNYAKDHAAESMILCEGYMDVIALHAAGFENAVATLGTAITAEQARIFAKYTQKVIITYDSDAAGQAAASKAIRLLGEVGVDVRILKLQGAKDPDEFIRKFGKEKFSEALNGSQSDFDFKIGKMLSEYNLEDRNDRVKACAAACEIIAGYRSSIEQGIYIEETAERLGINRDDLRKDVETAIRRNSAKRKKNESREARNSVLRIGDRVNPDAINHPGLATAEESVLGLLLLKPEFRGAVRSGKTPLCEDDFFTAFGKKAFSAIIGQDESEYSFSLSALGEQFSVDEIGRLEKYRQDRQMLQNNSEEVFENCVGNLKSRRHADEIPNGDLNDFFSRRKQALEDKKSSNQ
ncbi:MAG: DNA primase [Clostridia bacterium]|nr:DNA primase [Clostridia bacterium]